MEWAVGQWVECEGRICKVHSVRSVMVHLSSHDGSTSWDRRKDDPLIKPFAWQVGKTYRTTLEGVTMRVESIADACIIASSQPDELLRCDARTGMVIGLQRMDGVPHLLPCLADEPSEPEPTLAERYTVEHDGGPWWLLRDNQRGKVLPFAARELTEHALELAKSGEGLLGWKVEEVQEWDEPVRALQPKSRYHRTIKGVTIDLYDIAEAYGLQGHAEFHAVKKILMAGNRGYKSREQDLAEAEQSIQRARELAKGGE